MKEENFNPAIAAVVSIRNLVKGVRTNWKNMMTDGKEVDRILEDFDATVKKYGTQKTQEQWAQEMRHFTNNIVELRAIMKQVQTKIREKDSTEIAQQWNKHQEYAAAVIESLESLNTTGKKCIPENEVAPWNSNWQALQQYHQQIQEAAASCYLQLQLIETYTPEEMDALTETILKHIPMSYTLQEAEKYTKEYMEAYDAIKKEASQKKNLWDRFLDILAGGVQQTPAQRVLMQRWVDGEKGDAH